MTSLTKSSVNQILDTLAGQFGIPMHGKKRKPLDSLVATILSQNTSDTNSSRAWENLKKKFPKWEFALDATDKQIAQAIRTGGLASQKSTWIRKALKKIKNDFGTLSLAPLYDMQTATAEEYLLSFDGVGKKTAACVLLFSLKRDVFPVDTHILRISKRLGWIASDVDANLAHGKLARIIPDSRSFEAHVNLISHGRRTCRAHVPRCDQCSVNKLCPIFGEK